MPRARKSIGEVLDKVKNEKSGSKKVTKTSRKKKAEEKEHSMPKKLEAYEVYFEENAPEDVNDISVICGMAVKDIHEITGMNLVNKAAGLDQRVVACMFSIIFDSILMKLKSLEATYPEMEIDVADRFVIGYNTIEDENDEKEGNFMIYITDMKHESKTEFVDNPNASSKERCVEWAANNIKNNTAILREISTDAMKRLDTKLDIKLSSSEYVLPLFAITYDAIVSYLRTRRSETDAMEYEINFISCFTIGCEEAEDPRGHIYIRPNINSKLMLKDDEKASSKY